MNPRLVVDEDDNCKFNPERADRLLSIEGRGLFTRSGIQVSKKHFLLSSLVNMQCCEEPLRPSSTSDRQRWSFEWNEISMLNNSVVVW